MAIFGPSNLSNGVLSLYNNGIIPMDNAPDGVSFTSLLRSLFPPTSGGQVPTPAAVPTASASAAPPLPPPINIPAAPKPYDLGNTTTTLSAKSLPVAPNPAVIPQQQPPQASSSPGIGEQIGNGISGIGGALFQALMPGAANTLYQRQLMNIQLQSLMQVKGMTPAKAIAILSNPALQTQVFGNPTPAGELKAGNTSIPVVAQNGQISLATGGSNLGDIMKLANESARQQAAATATGTAQGNAQAILPNTLASNDIAIGNIDTLLKDPNLKYGTGLLGAAGSFIPGSPGANVKARLDQVRGEAALQGVAALKGFGRININEFNAARDAIGRLNSAQSESAMRQALTDLRGVLAAARTRAGEVAGVGPTPPPVSAANSAPSFSQDQLLTEARRRGLIK